MHSNELHTSTSAMSVAFPPPNLPFSGMTLVDHMCWLPSQVAKVKGTSKPVIVTSGPPKVVTEQEVQATLAKAAPVPETVAAAAGAAGSAASSAAAAAASQSAANTTSSERAPGSNAGGAGRTLPSTASTLPLLALIGLTALALALALSIRRLV